MGKNSGIEWTDHTFNPWWGCTKVSPGCDNCYAETWAKRTGFPDLWGVPKRYRTFGDAHWRAPLIWNERARGAERKPRVFCASMADIFDKDAPRSERERLFGMIGITPHLDWLLLTKRIGNVEKMLTPGMKTSRNWWLGISVVNQEEASRDIPKLLSIPAPKRFLSCEPLLGPIDLSWNGWLEYGEGIDWVIVGGESGGNARPMQTEWARSIKADCEREKVAFFFKQQSQDEGPTFKKFETFPLDMQVRQWP